MKQWMMAALAVVSLGLPAAAQTHGVPSELLNNTRRLAGDSLQVCADTSGRTMQFDRAVAQAIADALFLTMHFKEGFGGYPTSGDGFLDELQIAMTNDCDIMMGMTVQENSPFPEWTSMTRPYASLPYVLMVKDDYATLLDIPVERKLGTALSSMGERVFITWNQQQPKEKRFVRLPYADMALMTTRVLDGSLAGALYWAPAWAKVVETHPEAAQLRQIPLTPVPQTVTRLGVLLKARDTYLRAQIDEAIEALVADGTIAALMEAHGYIGTAGDAKDAQ